MRLPPESIVIARPIEDVFRFTSDPRNDPTWHTTVISVRQRSPGSIGVGTTFTGVYDPRRRTLATRPTPSSFQELEAVLVELDPPRSSRLRVRFVEPPRGIGARVLGRTFDLTFDFEAVPGGTRVARAGVIHPVALIRPLLPVFSRFNAGRSAYLLELLRAAAESAIQPSSKP